MTTNLYDKLKINRKASKEEIKKAYKKMAKKYHPDRGEKNEEKIKEINRAYMILYNEITRSQYDETGETESPQQSDLISSLCQLFLITIEQYGVDVEIIKRMRDKILEKISESNEAIKNSKRAIEKIKQAEERLKATTESPLFLALKDTLEKRVIDSERIISIKKREIEKYEEMKEKLNDIEYDYEQPEYNNDRSNFFNESFFFKIQ